MVMKVYKLVFSLLSFSALLLVGKSELFISQGSDIVSIPTYQSPPAPTPSVQQSAVVAESPSSLGPLSSFQAVFEQIYALVDPSVVNIRVTQNQSITSSIVPGMPFGYGLPSLQPQQIILGSGFVWNTKGDIVTNNHVISQAAKITVTFSDGSTAKAQLIGADPSSDLAVIKVNVPLDELHPVQLADSSSIKIGQAAIAIGNPFGLQGTMTEGIISGLGRSLPIGQGNALGATYTIPDIIQTDAPINPGNSGGVLVDDHGRLIGVTSAIESPVQANSGVGFVIPTEIVQIVVPSLIRIGYYEHPWLGITGTELNTDINNAMNLPPNQQGILIIAVAPNGPAGKAGLLGSDRQASVNGEQLPVGGDVITAIDGHPVKAFGDLASYLALNTKVDQTVTLNILRHGKKQAVRLTLSAQPSNLN
jgi:serine protease Do